jgi:hypothetical protein
LRRVQEEAGSRDGGIAFELDLLSARSRACMASMTTRHQKGRSEAEDVERSEAARQCRATTVRSGSGRPEPAIEVCFPRGFGVRRVNAVLSTLAAAVELAIPEGEEWEVRALTEERREIGWVCLGLLGEDEAEAKRAMQVLCRVAEGVRVGMCSAGGASS